VSDQIEPSWNAGCGPRLPLCEQWSGLGSCCCPRKIDGVTIAAEVGCPEQTMMAWRNCYAKQGLAGWKIVDEVAAAHD
jgi:hypothetical protein